MGTYTYKKFDTTSVEMSILKIDSLRHAKEL